MDSTLNHDLEELRAQLDLGSTQRAYIAIVSYLSNLRTHFARMLGERAVSALYQGYFDMTYFALFPPALKARDLKLAIVFDYEAYSFKVWLAARNRKVQRRYWELLRDGGWSKGHLVEPAAGVDAIVEYDVAGAFALANPDELTAAIEQSAEVLLGDLEEFFSSHSSDAV
ncbi:MAG: hypothetical protein AB2L09_12900 [Coriobacteriia bacterium]